MYSSIFNRIFIESSTERENFSFKKFIELLFSGIFLIFILGYVSQFALDFVNYSPEDHLLNRQIEEVGLLFTFISVTIFAPIFEEIIFRGYFTRSKVVYIFSSVLLAIYLFFIAGYLLAIFILLLLLIIFFIPEKYKENIISKCIVKLIYVISILFFGYIHIGNFANLNENFIINFIIILPQACIGFILLYIRLVNGLRFSIVFHSIYNFILFIPLISVIVNTNYSILLGNIYIILLFGFSAFYFFKSISKRSVFYLEVD